MPTNCSHHQIHAFWGNMIRNIRQTKHLEHTVRDVIVETAKLCEWAVKDGKSYGDPTRLHFLFIDKKHGLAGWTKEDSL